MNSKELANELLKLDSKTTVLLQVGNDWVEVCGIKSTGEHRNAITFEVVNPAAGGVIVVDPEQTPLNPEHAVSLLFGHWTPE
mgnify:CR=1 FL=1